MATADILTDQAQRTPHAPALVTTGAEHTYAQLDRAVNTAAAHLYACGIQHGHRVAAVADTSLNTLLFLLACWRIGAVACPLSPRFPAALLDTCIADTGAQAMVSTEQLSQPGPAAPPSVPRRPDRPAAVVFTSGSSGRPKAALLSYNNLLLNARRANANLPLAPGDSWLLSLPLYHVSGLGILFRCLAAGATIALDAPGTPLEHAVARFRPTHLSLVATQLQRLLDATAPDAAPTASLCGTSPKAILLGGGPTPETLLQRAIECHLPLYTSYGLTETASQMCTTLPGDSLEHLRTAGKPIDPASIRIDDTGIIWVGGPTRFLGYLADGSLVTPFDETGFFRTGDLGAWTQDGYLKVLGRSDNMFISGGENIQPEEIEACLLALPEVEMAVVVGIPHPAFGTVPIAFVKIFPGQPLDSPALQQALAAWLPRFKIPHRFLPWPDAQDDGQMKISRAGFRALATQTQQ
jgi:O-succinylbenzoic acid--CoA ligase